MILLEIPHSEYTPSSIVLTGGTAKLGDMEEYAQQVMGLPVRVEVPKGIPQADEGLGDPAYAASAGLLLWGASRGEEERSIPPGGLDSFFRWLRSIRLPRLPFKLTKA